MRPFVSLVSNFPHYQRTITGDHVPELSATQKADAYDVILLKIRKRQPSVDRAIQQYGGTPTRGGEIDRFFAAFDVLVDENKHYQHGDAKLLSRLRKGL